MSLFEMASYSAIFQNRQVKKLLEKRVNEKSELTDRKAMSQTTQTPFAFITFRPDLFMSY